MKHGSAFGVGLSVEENKAQAGRWKMEARPLKMIEMSRSRQRITVKDEGSLCPDVWCATRVIVAVVCDALQCR